MILSNVADVGKHAAYSQNMRETYRLQENIPVRNVRNCCSPDTRLHRVKRK